MGAPLHLVSEDGPTSAWRRKSRRFQGDAPCWPAGRSASNEAYCRELMRLKLKEEACLEEEALKVPVTINI